MLREHRELIRFPLYGALATILMGVIVLGPGIYMIADYLFGVLPAATLIVIGLAVWSSTSFGGALLVVIGAISAAIALLISQVLSEIFGGALNRYALDGEVS